MPTLTSYRGLDVVSPDPTGAGGLAIQNDLKSLVDWSPKSVWSQTADPTVSNDQTQHYYPGSLWLRTNTSPPKLFVCQSSTTGAAVWLPVLLNVAQDTAPKLGGDLDVNGRSIVSASNGNIVLDPNGTGKVAVNTTTPGTDGRVQVYDTNGSVALLLRNTTPTNAGTENQSLVFQGTSNTSIPQELLRLKVVSTNGGTPLGTVNFLQNGGSTSTLYFSDVRNVGVGTEAPTSKLQVAGPIATAITTKMAAYTLTGADSVVACDATSSAFDVTLPTAVGITGRQYTIKRISSGANVVTVRTTSSQTIDGQATFALSAQWQVVRLVSDGANWLVV